MPRKPKEENDQLAKTIGEQITQAMERLNITVTELHKRTSISRTVLLAYTRGNYAPGAREMRLLCDHLDISPSVLLYGSNQKETTPFRLGDLQLSDSGVELLAFLTLLSTLTRAERQSLLTLVESISVARDANRHREMLASIKATLANPEFQQFFDSFVQAFEASGAVASIQQAVADEQGTK